MQPQLNPNISLEVNAASSRGLLRGALRFDTVMLVHQTGQDFIAQHENCLFDLAEVTVSDSAALALLLDWLRYAQQQRKSIQFANIPEQLLAIATATGISEFLPLVKN